MQQLHTNAVYLHEADTYFVTRLDMDQKIAHVERRDLDYYTQAVQVAQLRLDEAVERAERGEVQTGLGDVTVTTTLPMFKKIKFTSRDSLGFEPLDLPPVTLPTVAMWIAPSPAMLKRIAAEGIPAADALLGVANLLVEVAPMFAMCDVSDIGATVDVACLGREAVFLFDRFPGGMGFARRCLDSVDRILAAARDIVAACACRDGCPSCVGSAVPAFAMGDMDAGVRGRFPDKRGAALLLQDLTAPGG
jgi:DEAD/DEAH box helicase domain-containing protein